MSEQAQEQTTEQTEPELGLKGNPTGDMDDVALGKAIEEAMAADDAAREAEVNKLLGVDTETDDETDDSEPSQAAEQSEEGSDDAEAKPDEDGEQEAAEAKDDDEPDFDLAGERWRIRRKARRIEKRERELEEQRRQYEAAKPMMEVADLLRSGRQADAIKRLAGMSGTTAEKLYLELTDSYLSDGEKKDDDGKKLSAEEVERRVMEKLQQQQNQQRQQQQLRYLQSRVEELSSIGKHESLQKRFPYLGALPEGKLVSEMQQAVEFAAHNPQYQHLLSDTVAFASELNKLQEQELTQTLERLHKVDPESLSRILSSYGYGLSAKPDGAQPPATKKSKAAADASPKRTTLTDADTSTDGGATRDLSDEEQVQELARLLGNG